MKKKSLLALLLVLVMCFGLCACGGSDSASDGSDSASDGSDSASDGSDNASDGSDSASESEKVTVPNNGEWDEILCSGDDYHLVKKENDAYDGYKFLLGVVNNDGEWVQELTDTGTFVEGVRFRAEGSSETLRDSSCYTYLGEGVFLASPGVTVYSKDGEQRVGPWDTDSHEASPTGRIEVSIWECLIWNVVDNSQVEIDASKMSVFQDGYVLFCEEDEYGSGTLNALNTKCEVTELTCKYLPNKPSHNFPIYSEGLFFANSENSKSGFFDINGKMVIDLSEYNMARIPYSEEMGVNAPYFENGEATVLFRNNADSVFKAVIDNTGNFVGDPEKTDIYVF